MREAEKGKQAWTGESRRVLDSQPGLAHFRREWLRHDLEAGLSVPAVAVPIALVYAELAAFPPVVASTQASCRSSLTRRVLNTKRREFTTWL